MKYDTLTGRVFAGLLLLGLTASTSGAATFTVSNLLDNEEEGTLRKAINDANSNAGADTINFSVSGTIVLGATLPYVIDEAGLTIDGTGQEIIISGDNRARVMVVQETLVLEHLTVANGRYDEGGGLFNSASLTVSNCTFSGNSGRNFGGAIINWGRLAVTSSTFADNRAGVRLTADGYGGGILNYGVLTITDSTFSGNSADGDLEGLGGAIMNTATLTVANSSFSSNSANGPGDGGAIYNDKLSTATVTNSTFTDNIASSRGGAILNYHTLTITSSTFSGNSAGAGGGGVANGGDLNLINTILANSPSGGDCDSNGTLNATGVNLVMDGTCKVPGALSGDPLLGPLADNGGPTQTMALQPGSPAIDAVTDKSCPPPSTDQRGVARPQGPYCDIGAFEVEGPVSCRTTGDLRSGGSNDAVRITNQGNAETPYTVQFVNAQGTVQGRPVARSLAPNQSASNTLGSLLQQAGIRTFNPANLLQIRTEPKIGVTESPLQSVLAPTNGTPPVMMIYTCEPETPPK